MKKYYVFTLVTVSLLAGCKQTIDYQQRLCQGKWLWNSDLMCGESLMFLQEEKGSPYAKLLFSPSKLFSVKNSQGNVEYKIDRDFTYCPWLRTITLTADSRIPRKYITEMYPPSGPWGEGTIPACRGKDCNLFFATGHVFHDMQVTITYEHKKNEWRGPIPKYDSNSLPRTREKLNRKKMLNMVVFGDSISTGLNASGITQAPPFQPFYGQIVADILAKKYKAKIGFENFSKEGMDSIWGKRNIQSIVEQKPDLVILAWGMNDASEHIQPKDFKENILAQIKAVRADNPQAEFILVSTMTANPEWTLSTPELYDQYRDILSQLCDSSAVLADVTSVWKYVMQHKKYADLTGNGVNHPNDFGHRIYAEVILALLIE